jgi:hypothetical protein
MGTNILQKCVREVNTTVSILNESIVQTTDKRYNKPTNQQTIASITKTTTNHGSISSRTSSQMPSQEVGGGGSSQGQAIGLQRQV